MRPIDADRLKEYKCSICNNRERCEDRETVCSDIAEIDEQPTIEAEPVKHGRLVNKGAGYVECSVCGQIYTNIAVLYKCCPYCTARFDGGVKEA